MPQGMRIPALELEQVVVSRMIEMLNNPIAAIGSAMQPRRYYHHGRLQRSKELAAALRSGRIDRHRPLVRPLIKKVVVSETSLAIQVDWRALCSLLKIAPDPSDEDEWSRSRRPRA